MHFVIAPREKIRFYVIFVLGQKFRYQMKEYRIGFVFTMQNAKYLICIIMNINEKVKKLRKITHFLPFFFSKTEHSFVLEIGGHIKAGVEIALVYVLFLCRRQSRKGSTINGLLPLKVC